MRTLSSVPQTGSTDFYNEPMIASLTRLRLRSVRFLPGFFLYAQRSRQEMQQASGFLEGRLLADKHLTFWTFSFWSDAEAMKAWRGAGAHGASMQKLKHWCDEASVARWEVAEGTAAPDWQACHHRLVTEGRLTPVLQPSAAQQDGVRATPPPTARPSSMIFQPNAPGR